MSPQRCSREEMQGWQSNDSSLLAGTFHHAYLINDSTSPFCPEGELLITQQLFSLVLRSRPLCGHRQCCDYEELPRDIKYELEEQSSWKDSRQKAKKRSAMPALDFCPLWIREEQRKMTTWIWLRRCFCIGKSMNQRFVPLDAPL